MKMSTGMICNCKQVSYADVENALHQMDKFDDVLSHTLFYGMRRMS